MRAGLTILALLLLGSVCGARARADELDDKLAQASADAVRGLEQVAVWSVDHRLIGGRHRTLRRILVIQPEHIAARGALAYTRNKKDGRWIQATSYREPADWNKDALPEFDKRLDDVLKAYRNDAMVAVEDAGEGAGARRGRILDQLAALLPDDDVVHKARGDVRRGTSWVMAETVRAIGRRAELQALAQKARAAIRPPTVDEGHVELGWKAAFRTDDVLCISTVEVRTCLKACELCQAYPGFFAGVFGGVVEHARPARIYLLQSDEEAADLFRRKGDAKTWAKYSAAGTGSGWMPSERALVTWHGNAATTIESVVRQTVDGVGLARFKHLERGWVTEGVGRELCWSYAGIYGSSFVSVDQTQLGKDGEDAEVAEPVGDWMPAARDVLRALPTHRFVALLTKRLTAMRMLDAIVAYALGAYLIEGTPEKAAAFIEASIASDDAAKAVQSTLGITAEELLGRLRRWTEEMTATR